MRPLPCDTNQLVCRLVRGFTSKEGGVNRYCSGHSQEWLKQLQHDANRQDRRTTLTLILPILVNGKHSGARLLSNAHIAWARDGNHDSSRETGPIENNKHLSLRMAFCLSLQEMIG